MTLGLGRRLGVAAALIAGVAATIPAISPAGLAQAAPPGNDQVVAFLVRGTGNGHGRGMSQWGAYGRAVNNNQDWESILNAYYGGTVSGTVAAPALRVRLTDWDSVSTLGVVSSNATAQWSAPGVAASAGYAALQAVETSANVFDVYWAPTMACPGAAGWAPLAIGVAGPIVFSTPSGSDPGVAGGETLGACESNGSITHYRGTIELRNDSSGNKVVNQLDINLYLRGVVPKEVPASWGSAGGGKGMNALRAQAVAARSYALAQNRYSYAQTCDTTSCQVYGGAATRSSAASAGSIAVEAPQTNLAIAETGNTVRLKNGSVVSTEFSASNGPRTAGGTFPAIDDPWDDVPGNPNHRWTRILDADDVARTYNQGSANGIRTVPDPAADSPYDGIYDNKVVAANGTRLATAWNFRNAFNLPSPGFELIPITRGVTTGGFSMIGDSVGSSVAAADTSEFRITLDGVFTPTTYDNVVSRRTQGGSIPDGVGAANAVPVGTPYVLVELGYNDDPAALGGRIDAVMNALRQRQVGMVAWVNLSERRPEFATSNAAIRAAETRWSEMVVLDWESASDDFGANRWFSDNVHLTATGRAEFANFLRAQIVALAGGPPLPRPVVPGVPLRVPVLNAFGVPASGVAGVALNITAVNPAAAGWLRAWPCGSPEPPTSSVNFSAARAVEPNAAVVGVDATGEVCVAASSTSDVVVDVTGWFDSGLRSANGRIIDTREADAVERSLVPGAPLRVPVLNAFGVPGSGVAGVALNVTAVNPAAAGWLRVWPCGSPEPPTSSVNFSEAGAVEPNAALVGVDATGEVCVATSSPTEVVVDITGWFDSGLRSANGRITDTRLTDPVERSLVPGAPLRLPVLSAFGVPASGVTGVALNVTAVNPAAAGWLRVWPCGSPEPPTSSVNFSKPGAVEPNAAVVPVDATGEVCIVTSSPTEVVVDVTGWFDAGLRPAGGRPVDTRDGTGPIPGR